IFHSDSRLTWDHAIIRFDMHSYFQMPHTIPDPLSFVLNRFPSNPPRRRPKVSCIWSYARIFHELDYILHNKPPTELTISGVKLVNWLNQS
ncbi:uncharacterized protein BX663DRAFT_424617, partial [Cokeromyces recurvatus]|uniref:uncharacterized protein n=1 Tax=Cokeromyces recurvatus TaxID=90255 RepID=UPI00221E60BD